jgi:serine/threonine-protein kinase
MTVVAQAAQALHAAHVGGIVHRDVKPGNLIIQPDGTVMLVDFGVARSADFTAVTAANTVPGTALYMAPEQASGKPVTAATDVYALGAVAYHCLAGQPPFTGDTALGVAMQQLHDEPPPLPDDVPAPARALVSRALAKNPVDRYPSGEALAVAALAATTQAGVEAAPAVGRSAGVASPVGSAQPAGFASPVRPAGGVGAAPTAVDALAFPTGVADPDAPTAPVGAGFGGAGAGFGGAGTGSRPPAAGSSRRKAALIAAAAVALLVIGGVALALGLNRDNSGADPGPQNSPGPSSTAPARPGTVGSGGTTRRSPTPSATTAPTTANPANPPPGNGGPGITTPPPATSAPSTPTATATATTGASGGTTG